MNANSRDTSLMQARPRRGGRSVMAVVAFLLVSFVGYMVGNRDQGTEDPETGVHINEPMSEVIGQSPSGSDPVVRPDSRGREGSLLDIPLDKAIRGGWVAIARVESVVGLDEMVNRGYSTHPRVSTFSPECNVVTLTVDQWLRAEEDYLHNRAVIAVAIEDASFAASMEEGDFGVAILYPYSGDFYVGRYEPVTQGWAQQLSGDFEFGLAPGGVLQYWLPSRPDGSLSYRGDDFQLTDVEEMASAANVIKPAASIPPPTRDPAVVATAGANLAAINKSNRVARETAAVHARATEAARPMQLAPLFWPSRHTGPMSRETAIQDSIARFPPGLTPEVAFAQLLPAERALATLNMKDGGPDSRQVWFVGLTVPEGIPYEEYVAFFEAAMPLIPSANPAREQQPEVQQRPIAGEYYMWNASTSALEMMGGITLGDGSDPQDLASLLDRLGVAP